MQSIDRAMNIVKVLVTNANEDGLSITELSHICNLPISSMHRILKAMIGHRLIKQDEKTKQYQLGDIWMEYGLKMYDSMDYISLIRPELEKLMHLTDESVYLSRPMGSESLIIERIDSENNTIRIFDQLGSRIPMHIGAANKVMLAHMPIKKAKKLVEEYIAEQNRMSFWNTLKEIKKQGYGISHGERTEGTTSVAAPILNHFGEVHGAVSVGCISYNLSDERLQFLINNVKETGKITSAKLGYIGY
ncbi:MULTISPECIES: IclR family transcriptional regulator [Bacillus]|uniref:IclR family transcriptional regulator n=1 Tax=Bacillus TaxID=1386 RepID=UPI0002F82C69|nr:MULTISPECIES: IclR family transcriptional regulator [Bacillus]